MPFRIDDPDAMADADLARAFERGDIPNADFHHASHLRVAWVYLHEYASVAEAADRMADALRRFAASHGHAQKYHHTMTMFWVIVLASVRSTMAGASFHDVLRGHPRLLDKDLPLAFYSRDRLFSDAARLSWVAPDRQPLTSDAAPFCPTDPSGDAPNRPVPDRAA
jgi:hypothetical protein